MGLSFVFSCLFKLDIVLLQNLQLLLKLAPVLQILQSSILLMLFVPSLNQFNFLVLQLEVFFELLHLSDVRINEQVFLLHNTGHRVLLTHEGSDFLGFLLSFESELLSLILGAFSLEAEFIAFTLKKPFLVSFFFKLSCMSDYFFVEAHLGRVSFLPEICLLGNHISISSFSLVKFPSELSDKLPISSIIGLDLERLDLSLVFLFESSIFIPPFAYFFVIFNAQIIKLSLSYLHLSFSFIVAFLKSLNFLFLLLNFIPVSLLQVLLDFQPQDISIHWQNHLSLDLLNFSLLLLDSPSHFD